ncbi:MAG: RcpC/CpaB family pilus assembly protein [Actinomycetota bacterium]
MKRQSLSFSGKKIAARPPWVYAAAAGAITFLILAFLSTSTAGGSGSKQQSKVAGKKPVVATAEALSPERGRRGYAIRTSAEDATLELIGEGNRIDVIASFAAGPNGAPMTRTVISGIRLLRYDASKRIAVVEVSPSEAEKLAFSEANGQIRLSVCPPGPDAAVRGQGATFEDI